MITVNRMCYVNNEPFIVEFKDADPQIIAEELEAVWRNDPNAVSVEYIKQANGKRIWQVKDKNRIMIQYKENGDTGTHN